MRNILLTIITLLITFSFSYSSSYALAADKELCPDGTPKETGQDCGGAPTQAKVGKPDNLNLATPDFNNVVPNLFKIFFVVGAIAVVLMLLWGAVEWIFSGGNKEKVGAARGRIMNALIGFALLALAFLIASIIGRVVGFNPLQQFDIPFLGADTTST